VLVSLLVVTVALALAGAVTDGGLTVHTGGSVGVCCEVTWQLKLTVPLNPFTDPTWISDDETPLGATASGLKELGVSVNSDVPPCAIATGEKVQARAKVAAVRHSEAIPRCPAGDFSLDSIHSDLNMNGFGFN
jgi:hypothetical protein